MISKLITRRYPLLLASLLAVAEDTDIEWAIGVIREHKRNPTELSKGLLREAWRKRSVRKRFMEATRTVEMYAGDVPLSINDLPRTG